jgi:hypothetical protein
MLYLIWNNERGMWWKPSQHGYTTLTHLAGRWPLEEAEALCDREDVLCACPWSTWAREEYANEADERSRERGALNAQG